MLLMPLLCLITQLLLPNNIDPQKIKTHLDFFTSYMCIFNSKVQLNISNKLGNAVFESDGYSDFRRCFAGWLKNCKKQKIPDRKIFYFVHTKKCALFRMLRCHSVLIEDLLSEECCPKEKWFIVFICI